MAEEPGELRRLLSIYYSQPERGQKQRRQQKGEAQAAGEEIAVGQGGKQLD